ncbi:nitroreductase family protein [Flexivirga sp. ID2601S]|uniref:Nitroreductase family protein n=1 Tax=Flexivirga aerilata TaxID=1656889 RepID=A0A849ANF6_9MICO|nr:nitroreductase family protein [Flexivirga aerilata]NNG39870.1 nitroreductase family protein [Flexivirga aerilata]
MQLRDAITRRRMVRRFDADRDLPADVLGRILELAPRAPSAGFSQGFDFVVLRGGERAAFWAASADGGAPDAWLRGVSSAPVLIVCCSDRGAYLDRYAEPDKPWPDRSETHWPAPYWDVDTGMAAMLMLLGAVDEGLGGLFFGVPVERLTAVREALAIPQDRGVVGVIALGYAESDAPSGSTRKRRRRPLSEIVHAGRFGTPWT